MGQMISSPRQKNKAKTSHAFCLSREMNQRACSHRQQHLPVSPTLGGVDHSFLFGWRKAIGSFLIGSRAPGTVQSLVMFGFLFHCLQIIAL